MELPYILKRKNSEEYRKKFINFFNSGTGILTSYAIAAVIAAIWFFVPPYFEMQSFNKLVDGNATYWDVFWVNLQVNCQSLGE